MIVSSVKKSERTPATSFVNLSRMDYELVVNVLRILEETGMDDEELSFLLGKRNQYFFDLIDPRKKQKLKTDQLDPLAPIFGKLHRVIVPLSVGPGEMIQLHHAARKVADTPESKTVTYSHIIYPHDGGHGTKITWAKTFLKGVRYPVDTGVLAYLEEKIDSGYFREPQPALPLYLEMKRKLPAGSFRAMDLERALAKLMRKNGKLMCSSIDTQDHFHERNVEFLSRLSKENDR